MKRTRTGSSVFFAFLLLFCLSAARLPAKKKENSKHDPVTYALIAGTTFRPPGFALPGSKIRIEPGAAEAGGTRLKPLESVTDGRGEFAVRVPAVPMQWTVHVQANGFLPQSRIVRVEGEQRVDLSFVLEPAQPKTDKGGTR